MATVFVAGQSLHELVTKKPSGCSGLRAETKLLLLEQSSLKTTQLAYPTLAQLAAQSSHSLAAAPPLQQPSLLAELNFISQRARQELHYLRDGAVVLYRRDRSLVWQVRYKLFDQQWYRCSTKHRDVAFAKRAAADLYDRARFKEELGIPQATRRFGAVADECLKQLDAEIEQGIKPSTNDDYKRVIRRYLIPFFGKHNLTNIDNKLVREFELWRNEQIGHMPKASTLMTHSAAYNRVIELAIEQGWLNKQQNTPTLSRRGPKTKARPGFTAEEIQQLLAFMPTWCEGGHRHTGRQIKLLLRDYVELLLATGMRCGKESLNMLWQHIEWHTDKDVRYLRIWVSGKTGGRWLIAKHRAAEALGRLAMRQNSMKMTLEEAIAAKLPQRVFAYDDGSQPFGFEGTFKRLLVASGLSLDKSSEQQRTLYSLRHTYATMELLAGTDIHTVARQMGTSVGMLEKHYSKLTATMAAEQLA